MLNELFYRRGDSAASRMEPCPLGMKTGNDHPVRFNAFQIAAGKLTLSQLQEKN